MLRIGAMSQLGDKSRVSIVESSSLPVAIWTPCLALTTLFSSSRTDGGDLLLGLTNSRLAPDRFVRVAGDDHSSPD